MANATQRPRTHRTSLAIIGALLVVAIALVGGAVPALATGGSGTYSMSAGNFSVTAGDGSHQIFFTTSSVTGGTGGSVCFQPILQNLSGVSASDFTVSPGTISIADGSTGSQAIVVSVKPSAPTGHADLALQGCNGDTVTPGTVSATTISVATPPAGVPILQSITPTSGPVGVNVQFNLASSATVTSVKFGNTTVTAGGTGVSSFHANAPAGSGTVDVTVTNASGSTTLTQAFTYTPAVTGVSPSSGPPGTVVTVSGSNLSNIASVSFGGTLVPLNNITNSTDSSFNVIVPNGPITGTPVDVIVTTTTGANTPTSADNFTYAAVAGPTITAVTGQCTVAGGGTVSVTGSALAVGATATIGGVPTNITVNGSTSATVECPAQSTPGPYPLVITVNSQTTNSLPVTYLAQAAPTVTAVTPPAGPASGGNIVTITGTNFQQTGLSVAFGANSTTQCAFGSSTSITCTAPAGTGTVDVVVTINSVSSATSAADQYTYTSMPVITSISPNSGLPGTTVTINGANFTTATAVQFGTTVVPTADVTINSGTQITATVPASLATGVYDIRVVSPSGTSAITPADAFTVTAGQIATLTLRGRFTLIGWVGTDGIAVGDALKGGPNGPQNGTNDITSSVSVIWAFDTVSQTFKGYFPSAANVPGANDLTTLQYGVGYFVGLADPSAGVVTWKVAIGMPAS